MVSLGADQAGEDKKNKRSSEKSENVSGGSGSRGANAVGRTAAGKEEPDDWKPVRKAGESCADVVKKVVDLADFISRVSTARNGDHIITGVAAEEPPELGARRDQCDLDRPADDESIPPNTGAVSAFAVQQRCGEGTECGDAATGDSSFPLAWKPTGVSSQVTAAESVTLRMQVFSKLLTKAEWGRVQLKPRDTIRDMIAKHPGCGGDDNIDTFDFRKPDFAASSIPALHELRKVVCGLFVKEFENKGSVHWRGVLEACVSKGS